MMIFLAATRKAELVNLPDSVTSPEQLVWYIVSKNNTKSKRCKRSTRNFTSSHPEMLHSPSSKETYRPCRKCDPSEAIGLNMPETFDTTAKTIIQFIEPGMKMGDRQLVSNRKLIPYHNLAKKNMVGNAESSTGEPVPLEWCQVLCQRYESQCRRKHSLNEMEACAQIKYLQRLLNHAIERQNQFSQQQIESQQEHLSLEEEENDKTLAVSSKKVLSDDELDVPYTQDWGDGSGYHSTSKLGRKEPLRPGDVITYRSHLFVAGDKRGERIATVIQVRPKEDPILRLDNNEVLLSTAQVKRIRVMKRGTLEEHPQGLYREIQEFKLQKAGPLPGYHKSTEAQRLGKVMQRFQDQYMQIAEEHGMPIDLINRCNGSLPLYNKAETTQSLGKRKNCKDSVASIAKGKMSLVDEQKLRAVIEKGEYSQDSSISPSQTSAALDSDLEINLRKSTAREEWNIERRSILEAARPLPSSKRQKKPKLENLEATLGNKRLADSPTIRTRSRRKSTSDLVGAKASICDSSSQLFVTRRK